MLRLEKLHPTAQLLFIVVTLIVPVTFFNPYFSLASLFAATLYLFIKNGKNAFKTLLLALFWIILVGVFNMLFVHVGETVLFTVKNTNYTLERMLFGFNQGCVFASVMIWFVQFGKCVDSERILYLFRFSPQLALLFSMVLGFIPRFEKKARDIREARLALNSGKAPESFKEKIRFSVDNLSALVTYSLESSIVTANSMRARNWNPKAIRASRFRFTLFDTVFFIIAFSVTFFVLFQYAIGNINYVFDPVCYTKALSIPALAAFFALEMYPFISEVRENVKWKQLSVKA